MLIGLAHFYQNRTRLECKGSEETKSSIEQAIRIEPDWNVKNKNDTNLVKSEFWIRIEPDWNVKNKLLTINSRSSKHQNRTRLECKGIAARSALLFTSYQNRTRLECKALEVFELSPTLVSLEQNQIGM